MNLYNYNKDILQGNSTSLIWNSTSLIWNSTSLIWATTLLFLPGFPLVCGITFVNTRLYILLILLDDMTTVELLAGLAEQSFHDSSVLYSQVAALEEQDSILSDMNLASTARQTEQSDEDEIEMRYIYIYISGA